MEHITLRYELIDGDETVKTLLMRNHPELMLIKYAKIFFENTEISNDLIRNTVLMYGEENRLTLEYDISELRKITKTKTDMALISAESNMLIDYIRSQVTELSVSEWANICELNKCAEPDEINVDGPMSAAFLGDYPKLYKLCFDGNVDTSSLDEYIDLTKTWIHWREE